MKQTTLFIFCLLAMAFGAESAASHVTRADYERADTILKCSDRVYSPAIHPEWIDSSHYFWYKNHEKEGDFYYLVNAESGKKQRAADKKGLAAFFSKKQKKLAESLLKEEEKRPDRWRRREEAPVPVVSPDKKWEAYVKDNNLYLSPLWDEKEKDKPKEEIAICLYITMYDSIPDVKRFIAYYETVGIHTFIVYLMSDYPAFENAFASLIQNGHMIINRLILPRVEGRTPNQSSQMNSCYYRYRQYFKYIFLCDEDEYLYSRVYPFNLYKAVETTFAKYPKINTFQVIYSISLIYRSKPFSIYKLHQMGNSSLTIIIVLFL